MNNITGNPNECCDEVGGSAFTNITTDNITNAVKITTADFKTTTGEINHLESNSIDNKTIIETDTIDSNESITKSSKFHATGGAILNNINIDYNNPVDLFYVFAPPSAGAWHRFQTGTNTLKKINNSQITVGSRFELKMGLQINDLTPASPNIVDFRIRIGNSGYSSVLFSTLPPKNLTPIFISIDTTMVCTAKSAVAPFQYSFVISSNYVENNDNYLEQFVKTVSSQITGLGFLSGIDSAIEYEYYINGASATTVYNRGLYTLYKTS